MQPPHKEEIAEQVLLSRLINTLPKQMIPRTNASLLGWGKQQTAMASNAGGFNG
jgi:hypothetical protein